MSTYRGHYLRVSARREVLRIYRDRRVRGDVFTPGPLSPLHAMQMTERYFSGWLAHAVAFEPIGRQTVSDLTDQVRAAEFYLERVYGKPEPFRRRRRLALS